MMTMMMVLVVVVVLGSRNWNHWLQQLPNRRSVSLLRWNGRQDNRCGSLWCFSVNHLSLH